MSLCVERRIFSWQPDYPFVVSAQRYWDPTSATPDGYTCILAHGTGFHGEQWEPTLKHLFALANGSRAFSIREVWSVECPNHGDAAIINENLLLQLRCDLVFPWTEYAHTLYLFLTQNKDIQFADRRVIAIGHSMGAVCLGMALTYPHPPTFAHLILCEPMVAPTDIVKDDPMLNVARIILASAETRRDIWPSTQEAFDTLKSRNSFAAWDKEVLKLFVKHGLRYLPTGTYPDKVGVTLKCPKAQEAACYRDAMTSRRFYDFLPTLCARLPVHVVWGARDDALVPEIKDKVTDAKSGRNMASISRVEGAGHLIVQMAPMGLASAIFNVMVKASIPLGKL